jgi:hypothetical protein
VYECVECRTACDCGIGKYCSSKPGLIGKCVDFKREGKSCLPLADTDLQDPAFDSDWKCADIFTVEGTNTTFVDQAGVCSGGTCRQCDYRSNSALGMVECGVDDGKSAERVCIYPGVLHETHSAIWQSKVYYGNPVAVWNAVFFPFLMIIIGVQVAILILQIMRWRRGGSGQGAGVEMSNKKSTKRATNENAHSTITPGYDNPPANSNPPTYNQASDGGSSRPQSSQIQYLKEEEPS